MLDKTTPGWAVEYTDGCGLSRFGHYACAFAGFLATTVAVLLGVTTFVVLLGVPELLASFAIVFGFFALWASAWLAIEAAWNSWIARRTTADAAGYRLTE